MAKASQASHRRAKSTPTNVNEKHKHSGLQENIQIPDNQTTVCRLTQRPKCNHHRKENLLELKYVQESDLEKVKESIRKTTIITISEVLSCRNYEKENYLMKNCNKNHHCSLHKYSTSITLQKYQAAITDGF